MSKYAVMPLSDYADACNSIREKTGTSDAIKSSELTKQINNVYEAGKAEGGGGVNPLDYAVGMPSFTNVDFANCPDFVVKVPNFAGSSINSMFASTKNLQSVTLICDIRNKSMTASQGFYNSNQLETIDLSNFNTTINTPTSMFGSCSALERIIGTLDFSNVGSFTNTFGRCSKLKEVRVSPNCIKATFDISATTVLSNDSITSIIDGLSDTASGKTLSLSKTAVTDAFGDITPFGWSKLEHTVSEPNALLEFVNNGMIFAELDTTIEIHCIGETFGFTARAVGLDASASYGKFQVIVNGEEILPVVNDMGYDEWRIPSTKMEQNIIFIGNSVSVSFDFDKVEDADSWAYLVSTKPTWTIILK